MLSLHSHILPHTCHSSCHMPRSPISIFPQDYSTRENPLADSSSGSERDTPTPYNPAQRYTHNPLMQPQTQAHEPATPTQSTPPLDTRSIYRREPAAYLVDNNDFSLPNTNDSPSLNASVLPTPQRSQNAPRDPQRRERYSASQAREAANVPPGSDDSFGSSFSSINSRTSSLDNYTALETTPLQQAVGASQVYAHPCSIDILQHTLPPSIDIFEAFLEGRQQLA